MTHTLPKTIDDYIDGCLPEIRPTLQKLRMTIKNAAPKATEKISWGMATFVYLGNLVHFSAEKKHIGFHPSPSAMEAFKEELSQYSCSKGTVQFPYDRTLPFNLIERIVRFRVEEQKKISAEKKAGKKVEKTPRLRYHMPDDVERMLEEQGLTENYEARPPYQRNDYIGWIITAKRPETREKRLRQMQDELRTGNLYMGRTYLKKTDKTT